MIPLLITYLVYIEAFYLIQVIKKETTFDIGPWLEVWIPRLQLQSEVIDFRWTQELDEIEWKLSIKKIDVIAIR